MCSSLGLAALLRWHVVDIDGAGVISQGARREWFISLCMSKQLFLGYSLVSADGVGFEVEMKGRAPCNRLMGSPSSTTGYLSW